MCMLRKGLAGGVESGGSSFEEAIDPIPEQAVRRFEHYELVTDNDGEPVELGRGAMGSLIRRLTSMMYRCCIKMRRHAISCSQRLTAQAASH